LTFVHIKISLSDTAQWLYTWSNDNKRLCRLLWLLSSAGLGEFFRWRFNVSCPHS